VTIPISYLRTEVKNAIDIPSSANMVRRLNFCQWLQSDDRWFTPEQWAGCGAPPAPMLGRPAILGIDLANTQDLAAAVLICPTPDFFAEVTTDQEGRVQVGAVAGHLDVLCWAWCPEARVREQTKRGVPYEVWVREKHLIATNGNTIDKHGIRRHIANLRDQGYWIQEIAYDPAFAADFAQDLQDQHGFTVVPIAQDFRTMTEPCQMLETLVMQRRLHHGNSPVLRFAAGNVIAERDGGWRMRPSKKKSEPNGKIDPISALVTGLKRLHVLQGLGQAKHEPILGPLRTTAGMPW
jgi:phage terminase large subunit-like protein